MECSYICIFELVWLKLFFDLYGWNDAFYGKRWIQSSVEAVVKLFIFFHLFLGFFLTFLRLLGNWRNLYDIFVVFFLLLLQQLFHCLVVNVFHYPATDGLALSVLSSDSFY